MVHCAVGYRVSRIDLSNYATAENGAMPPASRQSSRMINKSSLAVPSIPAQ